MKSDTVTTFQCNFHWCLSICCTVIQVCLYHTHKTVGSIPKRSCDTNFPLLCWTEPEFYPVCFSTLKKYENQTYRRSSSRRERTPVIMLLVWAVLDRLIRARSCISSCPFEKSRSHFWKAYLFLVISTR